MVSSRPCTRTSRIVYISNRLNFSITRFHRVIIGWLRLPPRLKRCSGNRLIVLSPFRFCFCTTKALSKINPRVISRSKVIPRRILLRIRILLPFPFLVLDNSSPPFNFNLEPKVKISSFSPLRLFVIIKQMQISVPGMKIIYFLLFHLFDLNIWIPKRMEFLIII